MADDSNSTPREQRCRLGYADLEGLSLRLQETAEDVRNPAFRDDIMQASRAVSDLASIRFGVEEIADKLSKYADHIVELYRKRTDYRVHAAVIEFANDLRGLIGKSLEDEERRIAEGQEN